MAEQLANKAVTEAAESLADVETELTVDDAATFPTSGDFRLLVDAEIMKVTGVSGSNFTLERAQEGTTAVAHDAAVKVTSPLTKGAFDTLYSERRLYDTFANRPAAGSSTLIHFRATDTPMSSIDGGSEWYDYYFARPRPKQFDATGFAWVNQGTSTITTANGITTLAPQPGSVAHRLYLKTAPAVPYTITVAFQLFMYNTGVGMAGLAIRETATGEITICGRDNDGGLKVSKANNSGATLVNYISAYGTAAAQDTVFWVRYRRDATTKYWDISIDGIEWVNIFNVGATDFLDNDQVGLSAWQQTNQCYLHILSWQEAAGV
jgi:hypothetical protein